MKPWKQAVPWILTLLLFLAFVQFSRFPDPNPAVVQTIAQYRTADEPGAADPAHNYQTPPICWVVRTYRGHGAEGGNTLLRLLRYISGISKGRWAVLLTVMDGSEFEELGSIVGALQDSRVQIFAELVGEEYAAKLPDGSNWNPDYHDKLYNLTDQAIYACPADTQWVVITNGDNEYDPAFMEQLWEAPIDVGIIAFDYYSRYQRPTMLPCERFTAGFGIPPCKENAMRFCQTDLGAYVINWKNFTRYGYGFHQVQSFGLGLNDGYMASKLVQDGWKVAHVRGRCLVAHAPTPQLCAKQLGVWDDSMYDTYAQTGGRCIPTMAEAVARLEGAPNLEMVNISVSNDGQSFGIRGPLVMPCIRRVVPPNWRCTFFPQDCAAPVDARQQAAHTDAQVVT